MLIEKSNSVTEQEKTAQKKDWRTPQCAAKHWQTPRLAMMPFNETRSADSTGGPESLNAAGVPS